MNRYVAVPITGKLLLPPRPLDPAPLEFQCEPFPRVAKELLPLLEANWREMAVYNDRTPLAPDWPYYFEASRLGVLQLFTVRCSGVIVGYLTVLIGPYRHSVCSRHCDVDIVYVDSGFRQGFTGLKLFRLMEKKMRELKVNIIRCESVAHFKNNNGLGIDILLKRLGYKPVATVHGKYLE